MRIGYHRILSKSVAVATSLKLALLPQISFIFCRAAFHPDLISHNAIRTNDFQTSLPFSACKSTPIYWKKFSTRCYNVPLGDNDVDLDYSDGISNDAETANLEAYDSLLYSIHQALTANIKQANSLTSELNKAQQAEEKLHRANLITSNLYQIPPGTTSITIQDWENEGKDYLLELNSEKYSTPNEEAEALFAEARRMKRGSITVQELLESNQKSQSILTNAKKESLAIYNSFLNDLSSIQFQEDIAALQSKLQKSQKTTKIKFRSSSNTQNKNSATAKKKYKSNSSQTQSFRTLTSPYSGLKILVGRNRRDNDQISLQIARKDDRWLHARGCPGAHVLIKKRRGDPEITPDCLQFAANLAAFYSDSRTERKAVISVAEPKHIQKPRGAPLGAVKIRQELQTILGNPMDVPEELKAKREENGGYWGDEGGMRSLGGKVKNRKKTQSITKLKMEKKRAEKREKNKRRNKTSGGDGGGDGPRVVNGVQEGDWF